MPDNYKQSIVKLQNYVSDDQMCMILSSSSSTAANKMILDCLIGRMNSRENLLDLCDQLQVINKSYQLMTIISDIRFGENCFETLFDTYETILFKIARCDMFVYVGRHPCYLTFATRSLGCS